LFDQYKIGWTMNKLVVGIFFSFNNGRNIVTNIQKNEAFVTGTQIIS